MTSEKRIREEGIKVVVVLYDASLDISGERTEGKAKSSIDTASALRCVLFRLIVRGVVVSGLSSIGAEGFARALLSCAHHIDTGFVSDIGAD